MADDRGLTTGSACRAGRTGIGFPVSVNTYLGIYFEDIVEYIEPKTFSTVILLVNKRDKGTFLYSAVSTPWDCSYIAWCSLIGTVLT